MNGFDNLILGSVKCVKCGLPFGDQNCRCYEKCSCGWLANKGEPCNNPETTRCSTKMKYGQSKNPGKLRVTHTR